MFSGFLYYLVVLLIINTYPSPETAGFSGFATLSLFILFNFLFLTSVKIQFRKLEKIFRKKPDINIFNQFDRMITKFSVFSISLFALNIYILKLPFFLDKIYIFKIVTTFPTVIFIGYFTCLLSVIWYFAYPLYTKLNKISVSRESYIYSNINLTLPVIVLWILLAVIFDIKNLLPFTFTVFGEFSFFLFFILGAAILAPELIKRIWRCTPLEDGHFRQEIEDFCQKADFKYADIVYWPIFGGKLITAGVMGLVKNFRYLLVTEGLLRFLTLEEIKAVVAHEIGHVKQRHLHLYFFFLCGFMVVTFMMTDYELLYLLLAYSGSYNLFQFIGISLNTYNEIAFNVIGVITLLIYFRFLFGYFMRNFERQADTYTFRYFDNADAIISTFNKIASTSGQPIDKPNWHHFSIKERIDYLKKCDTDRSWIQKHDEKVKRSIHAYFAGLIIFAVIGFNINNGETGQNLKNYLVVSYIENNTVESIQDVDLLMRFAMVSGENEEWQQAIETYERILAILPNHPTVLNNLAWYYATCTDLNYRNHKRSLFLALRAVELNPAPYILDTLAESYYANNMYIEAVQTGEYALEAAENDPLNFDHIKKQLDKFRKALNDNVLENN